MIILWRNSSSVTIYKIFILLYLMNFLSQRGFLHWIVSILWEISFFSVSSTPYILYWGIQTQWWTIVNITTTTFTIIVRISESKKNVFSFQTKLYSSGGIESMLRLSRRAKIVVMASINTNPSTTVIVGVGGICSLITGTNATNETMIAAILTILLWRSCSSKKIPKLMMDKRRRGKKMVRIPTTGFLKSGTLKLAALKASGLYFPEAFDFLILFFFRVCFSSSSAFVLFLFFSMTFRCKSVSL